MNRVFVADPLVVGSRMSLPDTAAAHLLRVLRLGTGDACVVFNGDGHDYTAHIVSAGKRGGEIEIVDCRAVERESPLRIVLVQGIARGEKMDLILQKATELGVAGFLPVSSERSEVRLAGERAAKRLAHWQSVVTAACEQSGRARVPSVAAPETLDAATASLAPGSKRFFLDPEAQATVASLREAADRDTRQATAPGNVADAVCLPGSEHQDARVIPSAGMPADAAPLCIAAGRDLPYVLAVGPEGGWSPRDRAILVDAGFIGLRLGPRILRTETAGIAAIAALQSNFGDL